MESSIRVQEQSATEGDSRVPDCPLNHVSSYMHNLLDVSVTINSPLNHVYLYNLLNVSVTSTSRALIFVTPNCLSPDTDKIYVDVSVSNTFRALVLVRIAPLYDYWYVISSH